MSRHHRKSLCTHHTNQLQGNRIGHIQAQPPRVFRLRERNHSRNQLKGLGEIHFERNFLLPTRQVLDDF